MIDAILRTAAGDGASAPRLRRRLYLWRCPIKADPRDETRLLYVDVAVCTRRRWESNLRRGLYAAEHWDVFDLGPFLVAVRLLG